MAFKDIEAVRKNNSSIEDGHIWFFYRPKMSSPENPVEVDYLKLIIHPFGKNCFRLIHLDIPRLPLPGERKASFKAVISKCDKKERVIRKALEKDSSGGNKTHSNQRPVAQSFGEGMYSFIATPGGIFLIFQLMLPPRPHNLQIALGLQSSDQFAIGRNGPPVGENSQGTLHPFAVGDGTFTRRLNQEGTELVFFRQSTSNSYQNGFHSGQSGCNAFSFKQLRLEGEKYPMQPLLNGQWR